MDIGKQQRVIVVTPLEVRDEEGVAEASVPVIDSVGLRDATLDTLAPARRTHRLALTRGTAHDHRWGPSASPPQ